MSEGPPKQLDPLRAALRLLSDRLPGDGVVLYTAPPAEPLARTFLGPGIEALTGYPQSAFRHGGSRWSGLVHPDDRSGLTAVLDGFSGEKTLEYRIRTADGQERWVSDSVRHEEDPVRGPVLVGRLEDTTRIRQLREEVAALQERLWRAQRLESVGAMAGGVAHDFNNLLTAILSSCQILRDQLEDEHALADLQVIEEAAGRGGALVRQVITFASRSSAQRAGSVSMSEVVGGVEEILRRAMGEDITLTLYAPHEIWEIHGEVSRLEQLLLNLAMNAREAMPDGGTVDVMVSNIDLDAELRAAGGDVLAPGQYVRLTVRDSGPGVPAELLDRIFDPFFSTKSQRAGRAGFGLTAVQRVARGYGGAVRVTGGEGRGTAFEVYLPVRPAAVSRTQDEPALHVREGGVKVLVVEDDPAVLSIVERSLKRAGHAVASAANAAEALKVFDRVRPSFDLVVSDVILPDRSGPVLVQALTRRAPDLAVVYMSGYGEEALGLKGGASDLTFLHKPFAPTQLLDAVRRALSLQAAPAQPPQPAEDAG